MSVTVQAMQRLRREGWEIIEPGGADDTYFVVGPTGRSREFPAWKFKLALYRAWGIWQEWQEHLGVAALRLRAGQKRAVSYREALALVQSFDATARELEAAMVEVEG